MVSLFNIQMKKHISFTKLNDTLQISEHHDGFWLYDFTKSMNLAMRAKTRDAAFVEAITYYQRRLADLEKAHNCLSNRVEAFVCQFRNDDEEHDSDED